MAKPILDIACEECGVMFTPTLGQRQYPQRKHYCSRPCRLEGARKQMLGVPRPNRWKHGQKSIVAKKARAERAAEQRRAREQAKLDAARAKVEAEEAAKKRKAELIAQLIPMAKTHTAKEMGAKLGISSSHARLLLIEAGEFHPSKRGRKVKIYTPQIGKCGHCGSPMLLNRDQHYRVSNGGYPPVCSNECLFERQRSGGYHAHNKFKSGPEHPKWVDGSGSLDATNRVLEYLIRHGNVPAAEIRAALGKCSDSAVSRARREAGISPITIRKHGYYSNVARETRSLIFNIRRHIKEAAKLPEVQDG